jgi:tetratricopeptide (TPR) repeat protein
VDGGNVGGLDGQVRVAPPLTKSVRHPKYDSINEEVAFFQKQGVDAFSSGDYDKVIIAMGKVIEIDPQNAEAFSTRCGAKANKGLLEEAKEDCEKSIEYNPDFSMAYNNLGYVLELEGVKKEAALNYEMSCGLGNKLGCQNQQRLSSSPLKY